MSIVSLPMEGILNNAFLVPRVLGSIQTSPYFSEHLSCHTSGGLPSLSCFFLSGNRYTDGLQSNLDFACTSSVVSHNPHAHIHARIPIGVSSVLVSFTSPLGRWISRKILILAGLTLGIAGTILLAFGDSPDKYWRFVFPGLVIGSAGAMLTYMHVRYVCRLPSDDVPLICHTTYVVSRFFKRLRRRWRASLAPCSTVRSS